MSLVGVQKSITYPINGISKYSPKNANSQIVFKITGSENQLLDLGSLRLCYTLRVLQGSSTDSVPVRPNNGNVLGTAAKDVSMDARTGASGVFDTIIFQDSLSNTLESVRNYPRLMTAVQSLTMSMGDYQGFSNMRYGAFGAVQVAQATACNGDIPMSQQLYTGMTLSKPISFSQIGLLKLTLQLSNSNFLLFGANAEDNGGAFYEVRDIQLTYNLINLEQPAPIPKNGMSYKHFSAFNQTIQAPSYQNQYTFNLSNTLNVVNTFIPSTWIYNYKQNSCLTRKLGKRDGAGNYVDGDRVDIHNSSFLKNNIQFPLDFEIGEREINDRNDGISGYDTLRCYYFVDALIPYFRMNHTIISPATEGLGSVGTDNVADYNENVYGTAIRYDEASELQGTNFMGGSSYLQRIDSGLDGKSPNEIYSFALSIKRLVPTPSGSVIVN